MTDPRRVTILGASSRLGRPLIRFLQQRDWRIVAAARSIGKLDEAWRQNARRFDLAEPESLRTVLADAGMVVSCLEVQHAPQILAALPPEHADRLVLIGSTRMFTRFPDALAERLRAGAEAFTQSGKPGVLLLPTMIYGAEDDLNVRRIADYIRRFGVVPLPAGGRSLVQPIHVQDVAACIEAALLRPEALGPPIAIAGPQPLPYREMARAIGAAIGRRPLILPVPQALLLLLAGLTRLLPFLPEIRRDEVMRLSEDKAFSIDAMRQRLGVAPMGLEKGLALTFRSSLPARMPA